MSLAPALIEAQTGGLSWPSISFALLLASLLTIAVAAAGAVFYWRSRSRRQLLQRVSQLEGLRAAGSAIVASELDIDALCVLIYQEAGKVIDNTTFQVGLFQESSYVIKIWYIEGQQQQPRTFELQPNGGLVGWVRETRQPLLIHDFLKEMDQLPARPLYISTHPPRSAIFIPLISGENVLGVMAAQSSEPDRYHQSDLQRLTILANQAASALANADLYQRERTRAAQLELVGQIAQQVNAIHDLEEIFQRVVLLTHKQFGFHPVNIFSLDAATGEIIIQASSANSLLSGDICLMEGEGLIGSAIQTRRTINARDVQEDGRYIAQLGLPDIDPIAAGTRSEMVIPLIVDKEVLGVLDVHSPTQNAFAYQEQTVLEALAAQVAIAIHKARQFNRQREQAWLTTAQLQMAEAISRSRNMEELLESITRLTVLLVGVEMCAVLLWDPNQGIYLPGSLYSDQPEQQRLPAARRFQQMRLAIGDWSALDAVHVGMESLTTELSVPWQSNCKPVTLYPLLAKAEMRGILLVKPPATRSTSQELLQNFSNQAAQAVDNVLLDIAQQEETWVNTALLQVAEAVNSLINLQDILATIVRFVPMLIGVESCIVLVWDEAKEAFHAGPSHGLGEMARGLLETFEIPGWELSMLPVKEEGLSAATVAYYTLPLPNWLQTALKAATALTFPLYARSRLVGALVVGPSVNGHTLTGRRLNILMGIAHQAAIAVVNDQLYRESAEREKLSQELRVAHSIQASLIPAGSPEIPGCHVASYWQAARDVSGDFYDFIRLNNGLWGIVVADVADKGMPAAIFMAVSRTLLRAVAHNRISPAETLERVNELLFNDTQTDLFVTVFYAVWDPRAETLTYANAGHNPPILLRSNGRESLLRTEGMALGVLEKIEMGEKQVHISSQDIVVFYTDGVTEAINEDYDEFGMERLSMTVKATRKQDAAGIIAAITQSIQDHAGNTAQFDDVTMVVLKRT